MTCIPAPPGMYMYFIDDSHPTALAIYGFAVHPDVLVPLTLKGSAFAPEFFAIGLLDGTLEDQDGDPLDSPEQFFDRLDCLDA